MGGICKTRHKERGAWFEVECVKKDIIAKEADGEDASFERGLLKSWNSYEGWEITRDALNELSKPPRNQSDRRGKRKKSGVKRKGNGSG